MTFARGRQVAAMAVTCVALAVGCSGAIAPARDQWKVYVSTDAPIPQFGEELLVELLDGSGRPVAPDAQQLIDASEPSLWPLSFGIVPDNSATRPRVRVRLYRLEETGGDGLPSGSTLLDAIATLPPAQGLTEVGLTLSMSCFGVAADPAGARTCDATTGELTAEPTLMAGLDPRSLPSPGSWPAAAALPCLSPPPNGMVCVPGGIFLLGSARYPAVAGSFWYPVPQRLVQIHPFAMDTAEFTVAEMQRLLGSGQLAPLAPPDPAQLCTLVGSDQTLPANCLSWVTASEACKLQGKRLPTEAEWEYAARNRDEESVFPWGSDTSICAHAVVARGPEGGTTICRVQPTGTLPSTPVAVGSPLDLSAYDSTKLGIVNLGGNLSEWVADSFQPYSGSCWAGTKLLVDPVCNDSSTTMRSVRGGNWEDQAVYATSALRNEDDQGWTGDSTGFRCAMTM
jgi:formylglycine-generating enzyme required for sulfatase activity